MTKQWNFKQVALLVVALLIVIAGASYLISYLQYRNKPFEMQSYIQALNQRQFKRAYSMLSSDAQKKIDLNDFKKLHQETFDTITLSGIRVENVQPHSKGASQYVSCDIIYETTRYGELKETQELTLTQDQQQLEWTPSVLFHDMEAGDSIKITTTSGKRGEIFDAKNNLLVGNSHAVTVYGNPEKITDETAFAQSLAPLVQMEPPQILEILHSKETQRDKIAIIKTYLPHEFDESTSQKILNIPGADIDTERLTPIRHYPAAANGVNLAHVLGYTSVVSQEDLEKNPALSAGNLVGRTGVEQAYDSYLQPKPGFELFISGADMRKKTVLFRQPAQNGYDIHLTIDSTLQKQVEQSMALNMLEGQKGCVIVLDAKTGNVDAMASYPTVDPYLFSKPVSEAQWATLNDRNGGQPLFNRATSGQYPPGSTIKPFTAAIAMDNGVVSSDYVFTGKVENNNWTPNQKGWMWPPITRYRNHNSTMNLTNSMIFSDNIYFADLALKTGEDVFLSNLERMGFTGSIPFQLPTSASRLKNEDTQMNAKLLADTGYGQGEFLTTPLQLASSYTIFSNQGNLLRPNLVSSIYAMEQKNYIQVETTSVQVWKENVMSAHSLSVLEETLKQTTLKGTGAGVYLAELPLCGKTGTAEVGPNKETEISWYVGYTKDPNKIVLAMIECKPKEGSAIKNHIVKDTLYGILGKELQPKIHEIPKESSD